jgi:tetrahydrodipicolinate N-succinyltransferase
MLNARCPYCRQDTAGNHEEGCPNNPDQSKLNYKLWEPAVEDKDKRIAELEAENNSLKKGFERFNELRREECQKCVNEAFEATILMQDTIDKNKELEAKNERMRQEAEKIPGRCITNRIIGCSADTVNCPTICPKYRKESEGE